MNTSSYLLLLLFFLPLQALTQSALEYDSSRTAMRKNIVRMNLTTPAVVGEGSIVLGYERVIKSHQSASINIGILQPRALVDLGLSSFGIQGDRTASGYLLSLDYRWYMKRRNRGFAPDGLYFAPFFSYYQINVTNRLTYTDPQDLTKSSMELDLNFEMRHMGLQIGYQFIFWKRLAIDLQLLGPSFGKYIVDMDLTSSLDIDKESELYKAYYDIISDRFPGFSSLVDDRKLVSSGHVSTNTLGFRYSMNIGFLF